MRKVNIKDDKTSLVDKTTMGRNEGFDSISNKHHERRDDWKLILKKENKNPGKITGNRELNSKIQVIV
uniref:Uncharacterized protein n=1 Tax=Lepeophtheirus salmonis TaxID=72036 RepID=A0A0K2TCA2_LEPSM